jgi:hypothetical protein
VAKKRDTGDGDPYSDAEEASLCDAIERAMGDDYDEDQTGPSNARIEVTAEIEWAGTIDHLKDGVRTTRLDGIDMRPVIDAVRQLREAEGRDRGPLRSYKAKGWQAQLRQLGRVKRGPAAMAAAGLTPSRQTIRRWASGTQAPSKANREKIAAAYDELRNPARGPVRQARHEVAEKFTGALRDRYGVNVRIRDIRNFRFR